MQGIARFYVSLSIPLLTVFAVALLLPGCSEDAEEAPPPRAVRVMEIDPEQAALASAEAVGTVAARVTSNVGFLVSGRLIERSADVGTVLGAGDLIARIDPTDYESRLTAAQSQVRAAKSSVDQAAPQEARLRKLLEDGFTTRAKYEEALQGLQAAQAQLEGARANLKLAEDQLKYTQLLAPADGVVTATGADVGQVVSAGQMIVQLAQHGEREAVFAVSPRQVAYAHAGMPIQVWLQDRPDMKVTGAIREVAPSADPITGTYQVKVSLPDAPDAMRLGSIVVGHADSQEGVMVRIPSTALLQTGDAPSVWVATQDGEDHVVKRRPISVLRYEAGSVILSEGLGKDDLVVVAGVNSLSDGQKVAIQRVEAK